MLQALTLSAPELATLGRLAQNLGAPTTQSGSASGMAAVVSTINDRLKIPPYFKGKEGPEEARGFVLQVEAYIDEVLKPKGRSPLSILKTIFSWLKGEAVVWASSYAEDWTTFLYDHPTDPVHEFLKLFRTRFGSYRTLEAHQNEFDKITQKENEAITEYATRFEAKARKAWYDLNGTQTIRKFLTSLRPILVDKVLSTDREFTTLREAITIAVWQEWVLQQIREARRDRGQYRQYANNCFRNQNHKPSVLGKPSDNQMDIDAANIVKPVGKEEMQRREKEQLCFVCGRKGHYARDCRSRLPRGAKGIKRSEWKPEEKKEGKKRETAKAQELEEEEDKEENEDPDFQ
jgi:hypothetical protein